MNALQIPRISPQIIPLSWLEVDHFVCENWKVVVFGAGSAGERIHGVLKGRIEVVAYVDNDPKKQGGYFFDSPIISPESIHTLQFDKIVVASTYSLEIVSQLIALGVNQDIFVMLIEGELGALKHEKFDQEYQNFYERCASASVEDGHAALSKEFLESYAFGIRYSSDATFVNEINTFSMLSSYVLYLLGFLSTISDGRVLEIGPYIGGSTVALAKAQRNNLRAPIISIEVGGSYSTHPQLPSEDILGDLKKNISSYELCDWVDLVVGFSNEEHVVNNVMQLLGDDPIGLVFIDADGNVERDFSIYGPRFSDNCIIVLDDYISAAEEKSSLIKDYVDDLVDQGVLESFGVFTWGTWFGRLKKNIWS